MLENPFLSVPQVDGPKPRSWAMGFTYGFRGAAESTIAPADLQPEDVDAFNVGILAGQDCAINGLSIAESCIDLKVEHPTIASISTESGFDAVMFVRDVALTFMTRAFAGAVAGGIGLVASLSLSLESFNDDPATSLEERADALQKQLQSLGFDASMNLFIGGGVDLSVSQCELLVSPIFPNQAAAAIAAKAFNRPNWLVVSWRTDQSNSIDLAEVSPTS
jgi:hypothetical protein